jgi:5-(carboxyamino)imidazole ribonucleotide mutase
MGSQSDWETMQLGAQVLEKLGIPHEVRIVSAHRTPDRLYEYAKSARDRGLHVIIAGAGNFFFFFFLSWVDFPVL